MTVWSPVDAGPDGIPHVSLFFITDWRVESFRLCHSRACIESLTGCGNDDTTGVETSPTGTAFAFPFRPGLSLSERLSVFTPPLPGIYLAAKAHRIFSKRATAPRNPAARSVCDRLLELFHLGFQSLLLRIFLRRLVKVAERPVDVIVGGDG